MAITYNAGTNIITVTGYTEGTPCNFTNIYNADVAGAWGVFHKYGQFLFYSEAKLQLGDGSTATWFQDKRKTLEFKDEIVTVNWTAFILVKNNAHFILGELVNATTKNTKYGCNLVYDETNALPYLILGESGSYVYVYSTHINSDRVAKYPGYISTVGYGRFWNCMMDRIGGFFADCSANTDVTNVMFFHCHMAYSSKGSADDLKIFCVDGSAIAPRGAADITLRNIQIINASSLAQEFQMSGYNNNLYCIDFDIDDTWNFSHTAAHTWVAYRQHLFDLKVIDKDETAINGATVKIWDKDSALVVDTTTNASGVIATQTLNHGYFAHSNTETMKTPHLIKIEKAGYTTYEADFTLEAKTEWLIALQVGGAGGLLRNPPMTGGMI